MFEEIFFIKLYYVFSTIHNKFTLQDPLETTIRVSANAPTNENEFIRITH